MKKLNLILSLMMAFCLSMSNLLAQDSKMYGGLDLNFTSVKIGKGDNVSTYLVSPFVAYNLNENMSVGLKVSFAKINLNGALGVEANQIGFGPFVRYGKSIGDKVSLFGELGIDYASTSAKATTTDPKQVTTDFGVGIAPGIQYMFANHWSAVAHFGSLGFVSSSTKVDGTADDSQKVSAFSLDLTMSSLSYGLQYHF